MKYIVLKTQDLFPLIFSDHNCKLLQRRVKLIDTYNSTEVRNCLYVSYLFCYKNVYIYIFFLDYKLIEY